MSSASRALQSSLHAALSADAGVLAALGGARVYDHVPRGAPCPYLAFGQSTVRDWSTGGEEGDEHIVTLHVWSLAAGRGQVHEIIGAVRGALHDRVLPLAGHRLVNLRHEYSEARREPDGERFHGIVRLRAVTEPSS
ncbi:MAG: DUF3168 domain-containing protein [Hyphomicrobiaceae bacterium]|nr:DUF3168 domain-containing protein [Hyphomicrobiaceae bacterium]